jgi:MoxR-like ATPase
MSLEYLIPDLQNATKEAPAKPVALPPSRRTQMDDPKNYLPDSGLVAAMRVAVLLRRPLLLTGEAGSGKTQAGNYLNWKLGYGKKALRFDCKSTSLARDLFYTYDTIGRFQAAQAARAAQDARGAAAAATPVLGHVDKADSEPQVSLSAEHFITFSALGLAILRANNGSTTSAWLPGTLIHTGEPVQSVVLIDEVDKAPRDFPNDLLNEIENNDFRVPELGNKSFSAAEGFEPLLVITSNSEKNLPGPFLRRCIYYHLPKPDKARFGAIVKERLTRDPEKPLIDDALDFLMYLRGKGADLRKSPSTAELLDFVIFLEGNKLAASDSLRDHPDILVAGLSTLVKDEAKSAGDSKDLVDGWIKTKPKSN